MRELLERWAQLEPTRCAAGPFAVWVTLAGREYSITGAPDALQLTYLLVSVIEAIEAREWSWALEGHQDPDGMHSYDSTVWPDDDTELRNVSINTHAEALLAAHLQALEAEAQA